MNMNNSTHRQSKSIKRDQCIHSDCNNLPITIEHALYFAGKQIKYDWALVKCCRYHNNGVHGKNKALNQIIALCQYMVLDDKDKDKSPEITDKWVSLELKKALKFFQNEIK